MCVLGYHAVRALAPARAPGGGPAGGTAIAVGPTYLPTDEGRDAPEPPGASRAR